MTEQGKARDLNEAAARFAETLADSYRLVYGQATESAERQQQRAQEFSDLVQGNLKEQAQAGRANVEQATDMTQKTTAVGIASANASANGGFPIAGYDEMNVEEVSPRLEGLSEDQLKRVREHEKRNKNRDTLSEQIDRKIEAATA